MKRKAESGNAIWFVLLAIALLVALTIAITRSTGTAEQTGNTETLNIQASALMQYASAVAAAVQQMQMRGLSENQISFANSTVAGYTNPNCTDSICLVFDKGGGGLLWQSPPTGVNDGSPWLFTGANNVTGVGQDDAGPASSDDNELLMILPKVASALCAQINSKQGISGIPQATGRVDISTQYTGSFPNGRTIDDAGSALLGKKSGCFQGNLDDGGTNIGAYYYFYYTLIQR